MIEVTKRVKLVSFKQDQEYIKYVFQNMDMFEYITCTRFPNWDCPLLNIGDVGYVNYKIICAGIDSWFNNKLNVFIPYNYSGNHFIDFIPQKIKYVENIIIT